MVRRFIYDPEKDRVVEIGEAKTFRGLAYETVEQEYKSRRDDRTGDALRQAALERGERREFAHRRYGDERRWAD